jgi:predicted O-methyltransferase YrrM
MAEDSPPVYWLKNAAYLAGLPAYVGVIRAMTWRAESDKERLEIAKKVRFRGYSLRPYQMDGEILALLEEFRRRNVRRIVEIGTARGGTLFLFLRSLPASAHVVSVDLRRGEFGGGYAHWKIPLFRSMAWGGPKLTLLRGNSQTPEMRDRVLAALDGERPDFILIDGDHSYEGAKRDFELYRELVAPGGMIAFHDIVPGKREKVGGVPKLWQELRGGLQHRELVSDWNQGGFGIGILYL